MSDGEEGEIKTVQYVIKHVQIMKAQINKCSQTV